MGKSHLVGTRWLAVDYHLPLVYSCRMVMSSMSSTTTLPAPGPATVRLAFVCAGIELFGEAYTRDVLYPIIRSAAIRIRPPDTVAISKQVLLAYRGEESDTSVHMVETTIWREYAHARGPITIYIAVPDIHFEDIRRAATAIGYWGQGHSFASCLQAESREPIERECATPLSSIAITAPLHGFISAIVSEFRDPQTPWEMIMPVASPETERLLRMDVYVWPLIVTQRLADSRLLMRKPLP